jgi:hypothetical protein
VNDIPLYWNCQNLREDGGLLATAFLPNAGTSYVLNAGCSLPTIPPVAGRRDVHVLPAKNSILATGCVPRIAMEETRGSGLECALENGGPPSQSPSPRPPARRKRDPHQPFERQMNVVLFNKMESAPLPKRSRHLHFPFL